MPTTKKKNLASQPTISLTEILELQAKNTALEAKVEELTAENESLKKQLHDLTDPAKQADAKAYRKKMGYE